MGRPWRIAKNIFSNRKSSLGVLVFVFLLIFFDRYQPLFAAWMAFTDEGEILPLILQMNSVAYLITFGMLIIIAIIWKTQYMWVAFLSGTLLIIPRLVAVHLGFVDNLFVDLLVAYFEFISLAALFVVTLIMYGKIREVDNLI